MLEGAILGPRIESVEHNALLAGSNEVFGFSEGLAADPIFAFGFADHFAESAFAFAIESALDATFGHLFINHVAKMDFRNALSGEIIDDDRFAAATHADDGENLNWFHRVIITFFAELKIKAEFWRILVVVRKSVI